MSQHLSDAKAKAMYTAGNDKGTYWFQFIPSNEKREAWINFVRRTCNDFKKIKNRGNATEEEYSAYSAAVTKWLETF